MTKKKKIIILSCMIALLAVTAVFNFVLTKDTIDTTEPSIVTSANYFSHPGYHGPSSDASEPQDFH